MGRNHFEIKYDNRGDESNRTEHLVVDERSVFSPAEQVQQKLIRLAHSTDLLVSSLHTNRMINRLPRN
jgi:hypothetical protein